MKYLLPEDTVSLLRLYEMSADVHVCHHDGLLLLVVVVDDGLKKAGVEVLQSLLSDDCQSERVDLLAGLAFLYGIHKSSHGVCSNVYALTEIS